MLWWFDPYCQLFGFSSCQFIPTGQAAVFWIANALMGAGLAGMVIDWVVRRRERVRHVRAAKAQKRTPAADTTLQPLSIRRLTTR